eukprot:g2001.t1
MELASVMGKRNVGVAFTGGGTRAMTCAMGQLRGLIELDLLRHVRYISGISGGSWATHVFSYYQRGTPGVATNDSQLLGPIIPPEEMISLDVLKPMDPLCSRHAWTDDALDEDRKRLLDALSETYNSESLRPPAAAAAAASDDHRPVHPQHGRRTAAGAGRNVADLGSWAFGELFLKPFGIKGSDSFTWDSASRADILARNPALQQHQEQNLKQKGDTDKDETRINQSSSSSSASSSKLILPSNIDEHPFPIVGMTLLGPLRLAPFNEKNRSTMYQLLEITPLYIGQIDTVNVTYVPHDGALAGSGARAVTVGGLVEPFAFGGAAPARGLEPGQSTGVLDVPLPGGGQGFDRGFSLNDATFSSSFAAGETISLIDLPGINSLVGLKTEYWSPSLESPAAETNLLADGGDFENVHLIGMLKRRVESIILFINTNQPLHSRSAWDPRTERPRSNTTDDMWPYFFGINVVPADADEAAQQKYSFFYRDNQVFSENDYVPTALKLQDAQRAGQGVVVTTELTTVENKHWGVEAGFTCNVTWVYLSRLGEWERRLASEAVRELVVPPSAPSLASSRGSRQGGAIVEEEEDYGRTIQGGPFNGFPQYSTGDLIYSTSKSNVLASMVGWGVMNNAEIFRGAVLGPDASDRVGKCPTKSYCQYQDNRFPHRGSCHGYPALPCDCTSVWDRKACRSRGE